MTGPNLFLRRDEGYYCITLQVSSGSWVFTTTLHVRDTISGSCADARIQKRLFGKRNPADGRPHVLFKPLRSIMEP
jgi:hypothetical protein